MKCWKKFSSEKHVKWIKTNVQYVKGLTAEQFALWKLHYKLGLQQHIDDKVFFAQTADEKARATNWKHMFQLEQCKREWLQQIHKRMERIHDEAEA